MIALAPPTPLGKETFPFTIDIAEVVDVHLEVVEDEEVEEVDPAGRRDVDPGRVDGEAVRVDLQPADVAADAGERRERDRRAADGDERVAAPVRLILVRVVRDVDPPSR